MSGPETVKGFFSRSKIVFARVIFFLSWFCAHTYLSSLCSFPFRSHRVLRKASADTVMHVVVRNCPTLDEFYRSICYSRNLLNKNYCIIQTIDRTSCCFVVCFGRRIYLYFYLFLHFCTSTINFCDYYYYYYYYYCYRLSSVHTRYID